MQRYSFQPHPVNNQHCRVISPVAHTSIQALAHQFCHPSWDNSKWVPHLHHRRVVCPHQSRPCSFLDPPAGRSHFLHSLNDPVSRTSRVSNQGRKASTATTVP